MLRIFVFLLAIAPYLVSAAPTERAREKPFAAASSPGVQARLVAQTAGISAYQLANGFKIILAPYAGAPTTGVMLVVKSGSLHEGYGETGMAHLLEHMLVKGAGRRASIKQDLTRLGARWNASTSSDSTSFFENFPSDPAKLDEALRIEADRFLDPKFTAADLASEMTVVRNELEGADSRPQSVLTRAIQRLSFSWHGYGRATIGVRSDIEEAPFAALQAFRQKHYRPDNAFLVVSGNFDPAHVLALVGKLFAKGKNPGSPRISTWTREPAQIMGARAEVVLPAGQTVAMSAWKIPGEFVRESIALSLASSAICSQEWGSMRKDLVIGRKIAIKTSCSSLDRREAGLFVVSAGADQHADGDKLSRELARYMEGAAAQGLSAEQLLRAKEEEANGFSRAANSHEAFAGMLAQAEVAGDWRLAFWQHDTVQAIQLQEANDTLKKWFVSANRNDVVLRHGEAVAAPEIPRIPKPASLVEGQSWRPVAGSADPLPRNPTELSATVTPILVEQEHIQARLISRKTQGNRAWIVMENDFGNAQSLHSRSAACNMASTLVRYGGGGMTRDQLDASLERLQASGDLDLGRIRVEAPRGKIEAAFDTLLGFWAAPSLPRDEFDRIKASAAAGAEAAMKDPSAVASNLMELRFDNYPAGHPRKAVSLEEYLARARALSYEEALSCYRDHAGTSHVRLAIVGDFTQAEAKRIAEKIGRLPRSRTPYQRVPEMPAPLQVDTSPITVAMPAKPNANIEGQALLPITDDHADFPALRLAINILGGNPDSRIFNRLREGEGLAYRAGASLVGSPFEPRSQLALLASSATQNADLSLRYLQEELQKALDRGFTEAEVAQARRNWEQDRQRFVSDERLFADRMVRGMLNGRDFAWIAVYDRKIAQVDAARAGAALRKHVSQLSMVWMTAKGNDPVAEKAAASRVP